MDPETATKLPCYIVSEKFTLLTCVVTLVTLTLLRPHNDHSVAKFDFIQTQVNVGKRHPEPRAAIAG